MRRLRVSLCLVGFLLVDCVSSVTPNAEIFTLSVTNPKFNDPNRGFFADSIFAELDCQNIPFRRLTVATVICEHKGASTGSTAETIVDRIVNKRNEIKR